MKSLKDISRRCYFCLVLGLTPIIASAEVVINEIAYHPITDSSSEEYIELYNTGPGEVDLSGWQFTDGISYEVPAGITLGASDYLVVAKDPAALTILFPSITNLLGPYSGQLNNGGERVRIENASGMVMDAVDYDDALPWPNAADGDGPSLELRHPSLDNLRPENWAASDITDNASAAWQILSATFTTVSGEFFFFLTDTDGEGWIADGETIHVLFDDLILEDFSNPGVNLITNGGFESGIASDWSLLGSNQAQFASLEDSYSGRYCLHYWALNSGAALGRRVVYKREPSLIISPDRTYRFSCRYRVTHGYGLVSIGAEAGGAATIGAGPVLLEMRRSWGTPGYGNSTWGGPQTPTVVDLQDVGVRMLPNFSEEVVATFNDTSLIKAVELYYSAQQIVFSATGPVNTPDQMVWQRLPMGDDPEVNEHVYRASIPSQTENTIIRYHLRWKESSGKEHRYPYIGSHPDNLVAFVPGPYPDYGVPHYFVHMSPAYYDFYLEMYKSVHNLLVRQSRPSFPATFVDLKEGRAYEDVLWKTRGWYNQNAALGLGFRVGVKIQFREGFYYNGARREFAVGNNWRNRNEAGIRTRLSHEVYRRAGVPVLRDPYVWWTQNGKSQGLMTHDESPDNEFLNRWGRDGNGSFYKARWHARDTFSSGGEGFARGNESVFQDLEDYERCYPKKNRRDSNHSDIIEMIEDLNAAPLVGRVFEMETNGSDIHAQRTFFEERINLSNLMTKYGVDYVLGNLDRGNQNHFLYQDVSRGGRWEMYPWDLDFTWAFVSRDLWNGLGLDGGIPPFQRDPAFNTSRFPEFYVGEPFFTRSMAIPEYRQAYVLGVRDHLRKTLSERQLFEMLDHYADEGRAAFREDIAVWSGIVITSPSAIGYCNENGISTAEPMDCVVAWFKDQVKMMRQAVFSGARDEDLDSNTIRPVLSDGRTEPLVPASSDPITFHVNAISAGSTLFLEGIDTVTVHYRSITGPSVSTMVKDTTVEHDGDYSYQIADQPEGTSIEYWFETVDDIGLMDRFPETGSLYTEVVDDPTSAEALVTITEIMYHSDLLGNEWVEIQNASDRTVDVSRWTLGDNNADHRFHLPVDISLAPGELLVIAANEFVVREAYGIDNVVGDFEFNLGNASDAVALFDSAGSPIDSVTYTDEDPWPQGADGFGRSLELLSTDLDNSIPDSWAASSAARGTPGQVNVFQGSSAQVVINEFSYDPTDQGITNDYNGDGVGDSAKDEFVELYNTTASPIDISGWSVDDDREENNNTFVFPEGIILPAHGFVVVFGGGTPTGFTSQAFTDLPRLGNNGDQIRLRDGATDVDSISFEDGGSGAMVNLSIRADGGVIARKTDGSTVFEARDPDLATPGESNNLFLDPSADFNGDSVINHLDLIELLVQWRDAKERKVIGSADLNLDNSIDDTDLLIFLHDWKKAVEL